MGNSELPKKSAFETKRTKRFRATKPFYADDSMISNIETHGYDVVYAQPATSCPAWAYAYTVGLYDTSRKPELIAVGLCDETAHEVLNEAARRLLNGVDLPGTRQSKLLAELDCEFRPVDPKWVEHVMGWAQWYYGKTTFEVLQAVFPDRENRFPEHKSFDKSCRHPLLQTGVPFTIMEKQFWKSTDVNSRLSDWKFSDPPHTRVFISEAVYSDVGPITRVSHDASDGAWQLYGDSMLGENEEPLLVCLYHLIDKDPTLNELAGLPLGWWAERDKSGDRWKRHKHRTSDYD